MHTVFLMLSACDPTCTPNPCSNGGTCAMRSNRYRYCKCKDGFHGAACQKKISSNCPSVPNRYIFDSKSGVLQSPGYPQNYPPNQRCPYFIGDPNANKITLTFEDVDVDQRESPDTFLHYGYGPEFSFNEGRDTLVKTKPASPIVLGTNRVWLYFRTNSPVQPHRGFKLRYKIGFY